MSTSNLYQTRFAACLRIGLLLLLVGVNGAEALRAQQTTQDTPPAPTKNLLWEVRSEEGGTAYLFGTLHFGREDFYPLPNPVREAFERSEALAVELDPGASANAANIVLEAGLYSPPESLELYVSKPLFEAAKKAVARLGGEADGPIPFKPWLLAMTVSAMEFGKAGYDAKFGVENHLLAQARNKQMPVVELESAQFQVRLFEEMPQEEQEALLASALAAVEKLEIKPYMDQMVEAWRNGDAQRLDALDKAVFSAGPLTARLLQRLVNERNVGMAEKVESFLRSDKRYFVAVGSLHLTGSHSIVEVLKGRGYRVRQL
jgi:uncharacterized protein